MHHVKVGDKIKTLVNEAAATNEPAGTVLRVTSVGSDGFGFQTEVKNPWRSEGHRPEESWYFDVNDFTNETIQLIESPKAVESFDGEIGEPHAEQVKVFPQGRGAEAGQPVINVVVEYPIDPRAILAGMAMQGFLGQIKPHEEVNLADIAECSVGAADFLIAELAKSKAGALIGDAPASNCL